MPFEIFGINITEISTFTMIIGIAIFITKRMTIIEKEIEKHQAISEVKHGEFESVKQKLDDISTRLSRIEGKLS